MTATASVVGAKPPAHLDGAALRVVVVNGSPNQPSKTMSLVDAVLDTLSGMLSLETSRIDVYRLGPGFTAAIERDDITPEATPEVYAALRLAEEADLLIAATPVFRSSYTGMFKHFFDLVDQYALANKLVLLAATGGSERHTLALDHALRPLFAFFQALTVPVAFFASAGGLRRHRLAQPAHLRANRDGSHRRGGPSPDPRNRWASNLARTTAERGIPCAVTLLQGIRCPCSQPRSSRVPGTRRQVGVPAVGGAGPPGIRGVVGSVIDRGPAVAPSSAPAEIGWSEGSGDEGNRTPHRALQNEPGGQWS